MLQPSLLSQDRNTRLQHHFSFGMEAKSPAPWKSRWTRWLCACCLLVLAPASRGPVCLDIALLWDTWCLSLIWFVGGWETPQPWWGLVRWGERLHPVCFHSFLCRLGWAMEKATLFPNDLLQSEIPCSCHFWGRIYLVFCEGHLAYCNSILSSSYLIQISKVNLLIICIFLLKVFLIMKKVAFLF